MPHGGPEAQDDLNFDPWRQFLVSRGYAVFQPQFRGGDGFGAAHEQAGHGQWGKLVQDDVTTGVAKLIADGIADPKRMCIFGWSYGGYMAMAGAAFSPDLYNCSVAGAGVADVDRMLAWEGETTSRESPVFKYWLDRMGDAATRQAASPADFAANVKIPMLLIHGDKDENVPFEQSVIMRDALTKAGKDVEFVELPGEEHTPFGPAMIKTLNAISVPRQASTARRRRRAGEALDPGLAVRARPARRREPKRSGLLRRRSRRLPESTNDCRAAPRAGCRDVDDDIGEPAGRARLRWPRSRRRCGQSAIMWRAKKARVRRTYLVATRKGRCWRARISSAMSARSLMRWQSSQASGAATTSRAGPKPRRLTRSGPFTPITTRLRGIVRAVERSHALAHHVFAGDAGMEVAAGETFGDLAGRK